MVSRLLVNDPVEVYGREEDRCLCFYEATIVSLFETDAEVRFADLKTEDNKPIIEKIGLQYLRPRPVNFSFDFKCGDAINVWIKDRWWLGKFVAKVRRSQAVCLIFKAGREETGVILAGQYTQKKTHTQTTPLSLFLAPPPATTVAAGDRRVTRRKNRSRLQIEIGQWSYVRLDSTIKTPKSIFTCTDLFRRKMPRTANHRRPLPPLNSRRSRPSPTQPSTPLDSSHSRDQTPTQSKVGRRRNRARRRHSHRSRRRDPPSSNRYIFLFFFVKLTWGNCSPLDFEHLGTNHVEIGGETKPESTFEDPDVFGRTPGARPNASRHLAELVRESPSNVAEPRGWSDQRPEKLHF
ncbi:hypothetical protein LXL04_023017 [Taraxacum kok-saghyz]